MIWLSILLWAWAAVLGLIVLKNIAHRVEGRTPKAPRGYGWAFSLGIVIAAGLIWALIAAGQALLR